MHRSGGASVCVTVLDSDVLAQYGLKGLFSQDSSIRLVQQLQGFQKVDDTLLNGTDVLIVSLETMMHTGDPVEIIRTLAGRVQVLVVSTRMDLEQVVSCLSAGAAGFVWKGVEPSSIAQAVLQVSAGEHPIVPPIAGELLFHVLSGGAKRQPNLLGLTNREQEVLGLIASGMSNKEIAVALDLSIRTVKAHVSSVLQKLNVADRTQAAVMAIKSGVVGTDAVHAAAAKLDNMPSGQARYADL